MARQWFSKGGEPHRGWYGTYWCDSAWELAFLMWHIDKGYEIVRNTKDFPYMYKRKQCFYRPDFLVEGKYYEIKGVMDYRSKKKAHSFPFELKIVGPREIKPYLEYAKARYGEDYWRLLKPGSAS